MLQEDAAKGLRRFLARPVALPFGGNGKPRDRGYPGLYHATHGHLMRFEADAARCVGDGVDIPAFARRLDRRHGEANLGPERREDQLLAASLFHHVDDILVLPRIDEGAVDRLLLWEDILKLLDDVAAALLEHRRQNRGNTEGF